MDMNELTAQIIGAAIEVHRCLGPGLLESTYEQCLCRELAIRNIPFTAQVSLPVEYKGLKLDCGYRIDLCVAEQVVLELKTVDGLSKLHEAQLLTYLKISRLRVGLLLNFNVAVMKDGIRRIVNNWPEPGSGFSAPLR